MRKFALTALMGLMVVGNVPADETIAEREAFMRGDAAKKTPAQPKNKVEQDDEDTPKPCRNSKAAAAAAANSGEYGSFLTVAPQAQAPVDPCNPEVAAAGVGSPTVISRTTRWVPLGACPSRLILADILSGRGPVRPFGRGTVSAGCVLGR